MFIFYSVDGSFGLIECLFVPKSTRSCMAMVAATIAKIGAAEALIQSKRFKLNRPKLPQKSVEKVEKVKRTSMSTGTKIMIE